MNKYIFSVLSVLITFSMPLSSHACTRIFYNINIAKFVTRSMDYFESDIPLLLVMPRGIERESHTDNKPLKWKSKYGSVVVTAYHTDAVSDGMNENGLAVHSLYLHQADYPARDAKLSTLSSALWAQYLLDNFKTVKEVVDASHQFQIVPIKIHGNLSAQKLVLEDASGDSAIIEFVNHQINILHGKKWQVATDAIDDATEDNRLNQYISFGGKLSLPGDVTASDRFVRAATYLKTLPTPNNLIEASGYGLSAIKTVMIPFGAINYSSQQAAWPTRWIMGADLTNKTYYFDSTTEPNIVWIDFKKLNFNEGADILALDPTDETLNGESSGGLHKKHATDLIPS